MAAAPGVAGWGSVMAHGHGPSGTFFNYADSHQGTTAPASLLWAATRFAQPGLAYLGRSLQARFGSAAAPELLLYFNAAGGPQDLAALPLNAVYADASGAAGRGRKTHTGYFRR